MPLLEQRHQFAVEQAALLPKSLSVLLTFYCRCICV